MEELQDWEREFYRQSGLVCELEPGEKACAVFWLRSTRAQDAIQLFGPDAVRRFAQALEDWKQGQPRVRRILGLQSMLEGRPPQVATFLVWGRYYPGPSTMELALVTGDAEAQDEITTSLTDFVSGIGMAECQSYARYLYDYR
jgi:hypothetical protein